MASTYFLVFLLGLLPLSTLTTAERNGGAAALDDQGQKPFADRFYMRGSRSKIQNQRSESVEKSIEKASSEDVMMQETEFKPSAEKFDENGAEHEHDGFPTGAKVITKDKTVGCLQRAKMAKQKSGKAKEYDEAKRNDFYNLEDMNH